VSLRDALLPYYHRSGNDRRLPEVDAHSAGFAIKVNVLDGHNRVALEAEHAAGRSHTNKTACRAIPTLYSWR
jgi:hypothetical protein